MSDSDTNSSVDCFKEYNSQDYVAVAAVRAAVGAFSAVCCLTMVVIIILHKKYRDFSQRLVLNLAITALIHSLSYTVARVNYRSDLKLLDPYCYFGGFLNQYSAWIEVLALMCIVYHLIVGGLLGRPTNPSPRLQLVFWLGTYILPLFWCWIPWIEHSYGTSGGWCGIRTMDENCKGYRFGQILQFVIWYIPLYILLFVTCFVAIAVAVKVRRDVHRWAGLYDEEIRTKRERIKTEIQPLLWFPFIYLILNTFSFIDRIYNIAEPDNPQIVLTFLHACTSPFRGAFVALVFTLASGITRQQWMQTLANCRDCYRQDNRWNVHEYPAVHVPGGHGDSLSCQKKPI